MSDRITGNSDCFCNDLGTLSGKDEISVRHIDAFDFNSWLGKHMQRYSNLGENAKGEALEEKILCILMNQKVRCGSKSNVQLDQYKDQILSTIRNNISSDEPVSILIPSFPFKFKNPLRTASTNADLAEIAAMTHLSGVCNAINSVYENGAEFIVATDGLMYGQMSVANLPDIIKYREGLKNIAKSIGANCLKFVDIAEDLIAPLQNEWNETYDKNFKYTNENWEELKNTPHVQVLIRNSRRNINLEPVLGEDIPEHGSSEQEEFDNFYQTIYSDDPCGDPKRALVDHRSEEFVKVYLAINYTISDLKLYDRNFTDCLRGTIHPKPGQLGFHLIDKSTSRVPWSGVGVLRCNGSNKRGYVTVRNWFDVAREPDKYESLVLDDNTPLGFIEKSAA